MGWVVYAFPVAYRVPDKIVHEVIHADSMAQWVGQRRSEVRKIKNLQLESKDDRTIGLENGERKKPGQ